MNLKTSNPQNICISDVTKVFRLGLFKKKTAVNHLSLDIPEGELVGLLGPNGSGKSTTLKMIMGFLKPTQGTISICEHPSTTRVARTFIGYLPENPRFQKFLTGYEILFYYGKLLNIETGKLKKRIEELFGLVNLHHASRERVSGYSKGMTQRLAIAQSLLNHPPVLIFDEPMSGLDPIGRIEIRKLVKEIHSSNPETTIFFSTHILEDVEQLCSHVALLRKGELATYCPIEELLMKTEERYNVTINQIKPDLQQKLISEKKGTLSPAGTTITMNGTEELITSLTEFKKLGARIVGVSSHRRSLEESLFADTELPKVRKPENTKEVSP